MRKIKTFRLKQYGLERNLFPEINELDDEINRWTEENGAVILDIKPAVLKDYILYTVIYETGAPEPDGQED